MKYKIRNTPIELKEIRFLFWNPAAEQQTIQALVRVFVGVTQNDLEIRKEFSFLYKRSSSLETSSKDLEHEEYHSCSGFRIFLSDLENPGDAKMSRRFVPIYATSLQDKGLL